MFLLKVILLNEMTDKKVVYQKFAGRGVQRFANLRDAEKTVLLENNLKLTGHTIPLVDRHLAKARFILINQLIHT